MITKPWVNWVFKNTDVPKIFIKALRYSYLSATIGRYYSLANTIERHRLNTYLILSSPAGAYFRSLSLNMFDIYLDWTIQNFCESTGVNIKNEETALNLPGGTAEGIADYMEPLIENGNHTFLTREHEMGMVLKQSYSAKSSNYIKLLIKMWKGESYFDAFSKKSTTKTTRYIPRGQYFSIIGSMQNADQYLTEGMSTTGFVRRLIISAVMPDDETKQRTSLFLDNPPDAYEEIKPFGIESGREMVYAYNLFKKHGVTPLMLSKEAMDHINKITNDGITEARKNYDNPYSLSLSTFGIKLAKLAALDAIDSYGHKVKVIDIVHVKRAEDFLKRSQRSVKVALEYSRIDRDSIKVEKWLWQAKGVIYRYKKKHGEIISGRTFQQSFCSSYKCYNPNWANVEHALKSMCPDIKVTTDGLEYIGTEIELLEHGISV